MAELQDSRWKSSTRGWAADLFVAVAWTIIGGIDVLRLWRGMGHMTLIDGLTSGMVAFLAPVLVAVRVSKLIDAWKARKA